MHENINPMGSRIKLNVIGVDVMDIRLHSISTVLYCHNMKIVLGIIIDSINHINVDADL